MHSTLDLIIEGLQIVKSVEPATIISAEHDVIIAGLDVTKYDEEKTARLTELGWQPNSKGGWRHYV